MNILIYLIIGVFVGWVASQVIESDRQYDLLFNIAAGIAGAFVTGLVLTPIFGINSINEGNFSLPALLVSLGGAVIVLAVINLIRRGGFNAH